MAKTEEKQPIIVKKIIKGGGGHHGGAWKIAYADFVTAMMAFFLLLWLLNATTEEQKKGIANYFDPITASTAQTSGSGGVLGGTTATNDGSMSDTTSTMDVIDQPAPPVPDNGGAETTGKDIQDTQDNSPPTDTEIDKAIEQKEEEALKTAEEDLKKAIQDSPSLKNLMDNLFIDQTPEGMRVQIVDQSNKEMFPSGSAKMHDDTEQLLKKVTESFLKLPTKVSISGHTDSAQYKNQKDFSNWELSAKRANASRRVMTDSGLPVDRISEVSGRADREPFIAKDPMAPQNRRISIILLKKSITDPKAPKDAPKKLTDK